MLKSSLKLVRHQSTVTPHYGVPKFPSLEAFKQEGIKGLLSQEAFQQGYVSRCVGLSNKLNRAVAKHSIQPVDLDTLVISNAKSATKKDIFNNASLLRNVSFAMSSLGVARGEQVTIPKRLTAADMMKTPSVSLEFDNHPPANAKFEKVISQSFGSLLELKTLLLESANAINGDGFTWLVAVEADSLTKSKNPGFMYSSLAVLNTYNAGVPENNCRFGQLTNYSLENKEQKLTQRVYPTVEEAQRKTEVIGQTYHPLLCIDASPKVWLQDYGVFGKKEYLEQVWRCIDWDVVLSRLPGDGSNKVKLV
ncbi:mitochondrial 37S ribosomal protein mS43 CYBJADRAFT_167892 [Cyberlindnera jadinii NRRL Y-1542]|uniref:Manganese/iron superoxide dismutase C-terminal domain-containing protein n=1 Tax=Cyberlindnera jadinii (strain ATCC 18201 / CBS 1600 / BCRC 20928 / JCM 3617 / NBRC 0987 / NRRL Y-1542) TaxID=983966 RepID=A0A1E4S1C2_CYBJN|nr:hypothetical protein CYBJADRAFT_167892 [Cyberlindnera jadinii NRRL Y-1542]ODV73305.1 hypothetical protein CYBJADRAFT_167892 [Cyberlindnera jadinii NRRL Y-1542]